MSRKEEADARITVLDYSAPGDGIVFLRSTSPEIGPLLDQWQWVESTILIRRLVPRLVLAASDCGDELDDEREDLSRLISFARADWCHWIACTNLERLAADRGHETVDFFERFGVQIYVADEPLANPLPSVCEECGSMRGDVTTIGPWALCPVCRESADPAELLSWLVTDVRRREELAAGIESDDCF